MTVGMAPSSTLDPRAPQRFTFVVTPSSARKRGKNGPRSLSNLCRSIPKLAEVGATVVGGQEIEEALVVAWRDTEQLEHRPIVAARGGQTAPHQLTHVVSSDIPRQEQRIDVLPERITGY